MNENCVPQNVNTHVYILYMCVYIEMYVDKWGLVALVSGVTGLVTVPGTYKGLGFRVKRF